MYQPFLRVGNRSADLHVVCPEPHRSLRDRLDLHHDRHGGPGWPPRPAVGPTDQYFVPADPLGHVDHVVGPDLIAVLNPDPPELLDPGGHLQRRRERLEGVRYK